MTEPGTHPALLDEHGVLDPTATLVVVRHALRPSPLLQRLLQLRCARVLRGHEVVGDENDLLGSKTRSPILTSSRAACGPPRSLAMTTSQRTITKSPGARSSASAVGEQDLLGERVSHQPARTGCVEERNDGIAELRGRRGAAEIGASALLGGQPRRLRRAVAPPRPAEAVSSISAAERSIAAGFAMPRPAMSGAEPWIGSKIPGPASLRLAEGARPTPPVSPRPRRPRGCRRRCSRSGGRRSDRGRERAASRHCRRACSRGRRRDSPMPRRRRPPARGSTSRARRTCRRRSRPARRSRRARMHGARFVRSGHGWYSHVSNAVPSGRRPFCP